MDQLKKLKQEKNLQAQVDTLQRLVQDLIERVRIVEFTLCNTDSFIDDDIQEDSLDSNESLFALPASKLKKQKTCHSALDFINSKKD